MGVHSINNSSARKRSTSRYVFLSCRLITTRPPAKPLNSINQPNISHQLMKVTKVSARTKKVRAFCQDSFSSLRHTGCQIRNRPRCISMKEREVGLPKSIQMEKCRNSSIRARAIRSQRPLNLCIIDFMLSHRLNYR